MYIVLEGVVGTGKSTQSNRLGEHLQATYPNKHIEVVREPGGTEIAETIRRVVQGTRFQEEMHRMTDAYLYAAARAQLLHSRVKPILDKGGIVISDRNFCSSLSYQGYVQGLGIKRVRNINRQAICDIMPDMILFMDLDIEAGLARTFDADGDKRERKGIEFFHKAYQGYQQLAKFEPTKDIRHRIDASGTPDQVFDRIISVVDPACCSFPEQGLRTSKLEAPATV